MLAFWWNEWNVEHIATHGVTPREAEYVARNARKPYPQKHGHGKWLVHGRTTSGRKLQVIYVYPPDEDVDAKGSRRRTCWRSWTATPRSHT